MNTLVFTLPHGGVKDEKEVILRMLESGLVNRIHIRKPELPEQEISRLIEAIPQEYHSSLTIHSHPVLLEEYPGVGWHFSSKRKPAYTSGLLSCSCHSTQEVARLGQICDYATLSPVFNSISKPGYLSAEFSPKAVKAAAQITSLVALGGVTPRNIPILKDFGFSGAAMLGYAWNTGLKQLLNELKCYNS